MPERTEFEKQRELLRTRFEAWEDALQKKSQTLGPPPQINPLDLSSAGWGVILAEEPFSKTEQAVWTALQPLVALRERQMGKTARILRYKKDQTWSDFLWEASGKKVVTGNMRVDYIPYYVCLVGSPQRIPWDFQTMLDGEYAVGRLWFDDPNDAEKHVASLLTPAAQHSTVRATFASTEEDKTTKQAKQAMIAPIHATIQTLANVDAKQLSEATRETILNELCSHSHSARFLMTASHGLSAPDRLGALKLTDGILAASDLPQDVSCQGLIYWMYACYSAGGPDRYQPKTTAVNAVVSLLPQKLLAAGARAVIGYIGEVANYAFMGPTEKMLGPQAEALATVVQQIVDGVPIGHALDYLNQQARSWGAASCAFSDKGIATDEDKSDEFLEAYMDALGTALLGDPVVRLYETSTATNLVPLQLQLPEEMIIWLQSQGEIQDVITEILQEYRGKGR
jgi:hypothetical protein